ncbi:MAG: cytochrome P450 [Actinomycetota bacterium]|nr:cytochrome P450 [Actinomycetota bacterium]
MVRVAASVYGGERRAPGPRGRFLVGNLRDFRGDRLLDTMEHNWAQYGDIVRFCVGPRTVHVVSRPDLAHQVLTKEKERFPRIHEGSDTKIGLGLVFGDGLLTNRDHDSWFARRRMLQPVFHRRRIATMADEMAAAGWKMLSRWEALYTSGDVFDIHEEMMRVTLEVISRTMFGADVTGEVGRVGPAVTIAARYAFAHLQNPFPVPRWVPTRRNQEFRRALETIDSLVLDLIRARQLARNSDGEARGDLLDMLLDAEDAETGERMTEAEVLDEVKTVFGAGHETTANALTWTWLLLSEHPEVGEALRAELDAVLGGHSPTLADLPNLPYTKQVFDEVMRLYPPVPALIRRAERATTLGSYEIPAASRILVSIFNVHRHPEFWQNPARFEPERFSREPGASHHGSVYMPFGAGQHKCIGNNLALMEGPLLLAMIAQRYELDLAPGCSVEREVAVTMRPKKGLYMSLRPRHNVSWSS